MCHLIFFVRQGQQPFTYVSGTIILPNLEGTSDGSFNTWLGIDCNGFTWASLSIGVSLSKRSGIVGGTGERHRLPLRVGFHHSCVEQLGGRGPLASATISRHSRSALVTVYWPPSMLPPPNHATIKLENIKTCGMVEIVVNNTKPLHRYTVQWAVERYNTFPFPNFGNVTDLLRHYCHGCQRECLLPL